MDRISDLEARIARLESVLLNFAAGIAGTPGELERVANTLEMRAESEFRKGNEADIDPDTRAKAIHKIARKLIGNGPVSHSDVMRMVQGILNARQLQSLMIDLAAKGEVKIIKSTPERGKPTTFYEHISRQTA